MRRSSGGNPALFHAGMKPKAVAIRIGVMIILRQFRDLLLACMMASCAVAAPAAETRRIIGAFAAGDLDGWKIERFQGETRYRLETREGLTGLAARADGSASGLYREIEIDLTKTPVVTWSWALGEGRAGLDPRVKAGDDHPLRLYFVVKRGFFNLDTIALQYVWSLSQPAGTHWTNPFADGVKQIAIDSGTGDAGTIRRHRRNLREDFKALFGEDITRIDVTALMTDADNAGGVSQGWYGDITFEAE
ncbi:DUF3047 domain-containing protein [Dongia sp.]|uniref:DUF3047 domain-containing protein n=1 Tax=Dongia sp. TaxID=1977262 RepID=UPI0035AE4126